MQAQDLVLEMNEARSEEVKLVEEKIKSKIMLGNQKVALMVQQTDIERNLSTELLETNAISRRKLRSTADVVMAAAAAAARRRITRSNAIKCSSF